MAFKKLSSSSGTSHCPQGAAQEHAVCLPSDWRGELSDGASLGDKALPWHALNLIPNLLMKEVLLGEFSVCGVSRKKCTCQSEKSNLYCVHFRGVQVKQLVGMRAIRYWEENALWHRLQTDCCPFQLRQEFNIPSTDYICSPFIST